MPGSSLGFASGVRALGWLGPGLAASARRFRRPK